MAFTRLTRLVMCATVCSLAVAADGNAITPSFKLGFGNMMGNVSDVTNRQGHFGLSLQGEMKLGVGYLGVEVGYRSMSGNQDLMSTYSPQTVANPYPVNSTLVALSRKADGDGFELGAIYRYDLPWVEGLYAMGGLRVGYYRVEESNAGTRLTTGARITTGPSAGLTSVAKIEAIAYRTKTNTVSPAAVLGLGYMLGRSSAVELNLSNVRLASEWVDTKNGLAIELGYRMRF